MTLIPSKWHCHLKRVGSWNLLLNLSCFKDISYCILSKTSIFSVEIRHTQQQGFQWKWENSGVKIIPDILRRIVIGEEIWYFNSRKNLAFVPGGEIFYSNRSRKLAFYLELNLVIVTAEGTLYCNCSRNLALWPEIKFDVVTGDESWHCDWK